MISIHHATLRHDNRSSFSLKMVLKIIWLFIVTISLYVIIVNYRIIGQPQEPTSSWNGQPSLAALPQALRDNHSRDTNASQKRKRALSNAANTLRCLTMPRCYPIIRCSDGAEPMKIPVGRKYEQQAFCTGDLAMQKKESKCLVYSFGINDNTEWEEKIAKEFGCDVYAFDPTSKFKQNVAPGVTFHQLGLQGAGVDVSKTHSSAYDALDPSKLRTLGEIMNLMGHEKREIDILRLDCEGCEWGVLKQLACSGESQFVKQLMIEMHFQKNLGLASDSDVLIAADAITCLENDRWAIASMEKSGCGPKDAQYTETALKFLRDPYFLLYTTMRRLPEDARWHWDLYGFIIQEDTKQQMFFYKHYMEHGLDPNEWPDELRTKYFELGVVKNKVLDEVYKPLYGDRVSPEYKTYELYPMK